MRRRFMQNGIILPKREKYLTILALEDGLTVNFRGNDIEYCINDSFEWKTLRGTEVINNGDNIKFRGNLNPQKSSGIGKFDINKNYELSGNCYSLLYGDKANILDYKLPNFVFRWLFIEGSWSEADHYLQKISPDFLYKQKISDFCYAGMFTDCGSLTKAPELPASTLTTSCYSDMFYRCDSLTKAPELPASTLTTSCYSGMFYSCDSLRYIKMLATDISASDCLSDWTFGVPSEGIFIKHPEMNSLPSGDSGIPNGWTVYDAYLGSGLEFPLRLNFDGYDVGAMEAYRHADSTSKMLAGYLAEILGTHGEYNGAFEVNSETLNKLGVEIYIEDVKVISLDAVQNDGFSLLYLSPESDIPMGNSGYKCTTVRIDNTGYITGDLEW